jgi:hypothetical protein
MMNPRQQQLLDAIVIEALTIMRAIHQHTESKKPCRRCCVAKIIKALREPASEQQNPEPLRHPGKDEYLNDL